MSSPQPDLDRSTRETEALVERQTERPAAVRTPRGATATCAPHDAPIALPTPAELAAELPATARAARVVADTRAAIRAALHDDREGRLLVVVGPCSLHSRAGALAYAEKLAQVRDRLGDRLILVMRTYFEKPRTSVGWKGFLHDPLLDGSGAIAAGLRGARELLLEIHDRGVPCASELLDPVLAPYLSDLLSWVAIGARTSESQPHRELASGLDVPVGFKNATCGSVDVALNAVRAAQRPHTAVRVAASGGVMAVRTRGNPDAHVVLRGGRSGPNYFREPLGAAIKRGRELGLARPVVVDASHDNSGFDPARQVDVCLAVHEDADTGLLGFQIESHLRGGHQPFDPAHPPAPDQSITDPCLGWDETEDLLEALARPRRAPGGAKRDAVVI